ncbi:MAG: ATP-dependent helicase HrpB [Blastochloris sp.]|nr:ATP-dependent helicase HrpB [Blastochloris sp.]
MMELSSTLPVRSLSKSIVTSLQKHGRLILKAPTGSGKSTQVPQILLEAGLADTGQIIILQPRRLATRLLAQRVAHERKSALGKEVGYQIRLEDRSSAETKILYLTEGILLRKLISDPLLKDVSVLIFDEFHERHLYSDISLARAFELQKTTRPDLKIVVMSATLTTDLLLNYLHPCPLIESEGRQFTVTEEYLPDTINIGNSNVWDLAAQAIESLTRDKVPGDALIFMPGAYEIRKTIEALRQCRNSQDWSLRPLYGELSADQQDEALAPSPQRRIIVATNVAETSITIPGIRIVIDGGLARIARYDSRRGLNTLLIEKISQASAEQRKGRAGRTDHGHCYRLWNRQEQMQRPLSELPEIRRVELSEALLQLKGTGVVSLHHFPWVEKPSEESLQKALTLLCDLGALDQEEKLTPLGRRMLVFPMHPRYSRMLIEAGKLDCVRAVCTVAALAQSKPILRRRSGKQVEDRRDDFLGDERDSDFFIQMKAWRFAVENRFDFKACERMGVDVQAARQIEELADYFTATARRLGLPVNENDIHEVHLRKCVLAGFADQVACRLDKGSLRCQLVHGRKGELARESVVRDHECLVITEISEIQDSRGELKTLLTQASGIKREWLSELFPEAIHKRLDVFFDETLRRAQTRETECYHDLVLASRVRDEAPPVDAARLLSEQVLKGKCLLTGWNERMDQWVLRIDFLRKIMPELEMPCFGLEEKQSFIESLCHGARSYKEIKDRELWTQALDWHSSTQRSWLEDFAPERSALAGGYKAKVTYALQEPPSISVKIQDLFGQKENPRIASGKVALVIKILAPNFRPVQVTTDLTSFWRDSYPNLKVELQRRYPKHKWL